MTKEDSRREGLTKRVECQFRCIGCSGQVEIIWSNMLALGEMQGLPSPGPLPSNLDLQSTVSEREREREAKGRKMGNMKPRIQVVCLPMCNLSEMC